MQRKSRSLHKSESGVIGYSCVYHISSSTVL
nr:hypothetical protein KV8917_900049 [Klebsiella variicola]